ncbi:hypothetical protein TNCV_902761 [Trichonephila clavipes]|nr:hypothetical protein TNCV_902761 [Trichonephila clavipes]
MEDIKKDHFEPVTEQGVASSGIQSTVQQIYEMERRGLQSCPKLKQADIEANRLQLMKQDLEKRGECLLEQFHFEEVEDVTWCYGCKAMEIKWQE